MKADTNARWRHNREEEVQAKIPDQQGCVNAQQIESNNASDRSFTRQEEANSDCPSVETFYQPCRAENVPSGRPAAAASRRER